MSTQSLYSRFATTTSRKNYLKTLVQRSHNDFPLWLTGFGVNPISRLRTGFENQKAAYLVWLESLVRAISIDSNLEDTSRKELKDADPVRTIGERKFNLLVGEASLSGIDVLNKVDERIFFGVVGSRDLTGSNDRSNWRFVRLGGVDSGDVYAYEEPTGTTWGVDGEGNPQVVADNIITVQNGVTIPEGVPWYDWIRQHDSSSNSTS